MKTFKTKSGDKILVTGDPHLGRRFTNGVPLDKRGLREASMVDQFLEEMIEPADYHVIIGDLFDKAQVSNETLFDVLGALRSTPPDKLVLVMAGNHDLHKDVDRASSFEVLAAMASGIDNVVFVYDSVWISPNKDFACVPWDPVATAKDMVRELPSGLEYVFTHMDFEVFGDDEHNWMPYRLLSEKTETVVNGHIHKPKTFMFDDTTIIGVGSMQPYAHGEETDESLYLTRTLDSLDDKLDYSGKCLRLLLEPGQETPDGLVYNQLTIKRVSAEEIESLADLEVEVEEFDFQKLFSETMKGNGVGDDLSMTLWNRYLEVRQS